MITYHLQPPPAQRAGGLDAAIQGLCGALRESGVGVEHVLPSELPPDAVVHLHGLWQRPFPAAARQCRAQKIPYVVSPHGMLEPWAWRHKWWKKWPYFLAVERGLLRGAAALLATANDEAGRLRQRVPGQRVEALPLGLTGEARPAYHAARRLLGWPVEERVLLFLSRLHPKKGLEHLLEALTLLPPTGPLRVVVVGDGEPGYEQALRDFAAARAAKLPRIDWVGAVWGEERWPYFQGSDLFCLPTYSENFGLAVLEALQVGTPVLTTHTTPWGSQLAPPRGFICDPSAASVAGALAAFFAQPDATTSARASLSQWAHDHYSWQHLAGSYLEFYRSLRVV